MGLFKKKETIPTIPTAPSLPSLPELPPLQPAKEEPAKKDLPGLPSFPPNPKNEDINREIVKSAVSKGPSHEEAQALPTVPSSIHVEEMPKDIPALPLKPETPSSIPKLPESIVPIKPESPGPQKLEAQKIPTQPSHPQAQPEKSNEPIFVRIDKFQAAQKNFDEIKSKLAEIEIVLQRIKDVKSQEEEELKGWTEDTEKLKAKLAEIDDDLFSKL